jgi:hypothetical protein
MYLILYYIYPAHVQCVALYLELPLRTILSSKILHLLSRLFPL